jgi:ABC-type sugar transport system permease subunit
VLNAAFGAFRQVVFNFIVWTVGVVVLQNLPGFGAALLLNQNLLGQGLMRSLILLPWVLPGVVAAILWRFMYDPQFGLITSFLIGLGFSGVPGWRRLRRRIGRRSSRRCGKAFRSRPSYISRHCRTSIRSRSSPP